MKVLVVFGTRPEAVKLALVIHRLRAAGVDCRVCLTAQHREMVDPLLDLFEIAPDIDLDVMRADQALGSLAASLLQRLDRVISAERPDRVVVQGDTTTTLAGALTAYYHRVPVAHVEAGLRSADLQNPFPEEGNRRMVDAISSWLFPPTEAAADNLRAEGTPDERIEVTGNTVIDALRFVTERLERNGARHQLRRRLEHQHGIPDDDRPLVLVTGHRRESFGSEFEDICKGLRRLAQACPGVAVVYPVHLNPNVQAPVRRILNGVEGIHLTPPLDYVPFVDLLSRADLVLTDSGGVLEEATALGKPTLIMRHKTERPEAVAAGLAKLVGTRADHIADEAERLLSDPDARAVMSGESPFGDGRASERIVDALVAHHQTPVQMGAG